MIRRAAYALGLVALGALSACVGGGTARAPEIAPGGPPQVRTGVVARHAAEFDRGELRARPAGSQQELSAATYILGHLQRAGYAARLEGVPVEDLVRSTDVLALPPGGGTPATVVTVAYDTSEATGATGADVGLFLELARALVVADPRHDVLFAALGAENTRIGGGHLGSRRLIDWLEEQGADPLVVAIEGVGRGGVCIEQGPVTIAGPSGCGDFTSGRPYAGAGLARAVASGPPGRLGRRLLHLLRRPSG